MGLDMYLSAKMYLYSHKKKNGKIKVSGVGTTPKMLELKELSYKALYWRKSNEIHKWFVDNVQNGNDDCHEYYVDRSQLKELTDLIKTVLGDKSKADELLPTQNGFYFGGMSYDEDYFDSLESTKDKLEELLKLPNDYDFYYQSSW